MSLARARNLAVLPFATLLAIALTVSPGHASADTAVPSGMTVVATGTITGSSGAAMADEPVSLLAWPSDVVLKAMNVGQQVPTTVLATATTNSAGNYTLQVPVAKLKAAAVSSGYANLEVFSAVGGFFFLPYQTGLLPAHPASPVTVNLSQKKGLSCGVDPDGQLYNFTGFFLEYKRARLRDCRAGLYTPVEQNQRRQCVLQLYLGFEPQPVHLAGRRGIRVRRRCRLQGRRHALLHRQPLSQLPIQARERLVRDPVQHRAVQGHLLRSPK
jgi:hypothetical protein